MITKTDDSFYLYLPHLPTLFDVFELENDFI